MIEILQQITDSFEMSPYDINNGNCEYWANEVMEALPDHAVEVWEVHGTGQTSHIFLKIDGLFYDAEKLGGCEDYCQLPIFQKLDKIQPIWRIDHNGTYSGPDRYNLTQEQIDEYNELFN